jgi:catechol 2,3-dioxygenase-like lactoylglutathione lyase family enzyme
VLRPPDTHPALETIEGLGGYAQRTAAIGFPDESGQDLTVVASSVLVMDWKLELVALPVSDVDRAKAFYVDQVGFVADHDHRVNDQLRFVQLTPPGSACSLVLGEGITQMEPGSQKGLQIVVADVDQARRQLAARGVEVSEIDEQPWGRFVYFADPDDNTWALQQLPPRG